MMLPHLKENEKFSELCSKILKLFPTPKVGALKDLLEIQKIDWLLVNTKPVMDAMLLKPAQIILFPSTENKYNIFINSNVWFSGSELLAKRQRATTLGTAAGNFGQSY